VLLVLQIDDIGNVNKVYEPPGFGVGAQEAISDSGDSILRYTITAKPPPIS
jgi:hypothetical protein